MSIIFDMFDQKKLTQNLPARVEPATGSTILPYIIEHIAKRFFQPLPVVGAEKFHIDKSSYIDMKSQHPRNQAS